MISSNFAIIGSGAALAVLAATDLGSRISDRVFMDNETPLVRTFNAAPKRVSALQGETVSIDYKYFRRPGCVGTVEYRLIGTPDDWGHEVSIPIGEWNAGWPEGEGEQTARVSIPKDMWPGQYEFVFITAAKHCKASGKFKASSKLIQARSLPVPITITKGST